MTNLLWTYYSRSANLWEKLQRHTTIFWCEQHVVWHFWLLKVQWIHSATTVRRQPDTHLSLTDITKKKRVIICLGKTDTELCPILALSPYLTLRGSSQAPCSSCKTSPTWPDPSSQKSYKRYYKEAGINNLKYASHIFRVTQQLLWLKSTSRCTWYWESGREKHTKFMSSQHQIGQGFQATSNSSSKAPAVINPDS